MVPRRGAVSSWIITAQKGRLVVSTAPPHRATVWFWREQMKVFPHLTVGLAIDHRVWPQGGASSFRTCPGEHKLVAEEHLTIAGEAFFRDV